MVACVVHKDAHGALLSGDLIGQFLSVVGIGDIELIVHSLAAKLCQSIGHQLRSAGSHNGHLCACGNKTAGNGKTKTGGTAGDDGDLTGQIVPVLR